VRSVELRLHLQEIVISDEDGPIRLLLRNQPDGSSWTVQRVQTAMDSGKDNVQVNLAVPVPVLLLYVTAVAEEDGTIHFFDDIYGHDKKLNALLVKGPPYP
jgi:L,D-transpeptidase YcbB